MYARDAATHSQCDAVRRLQSIGEQQPAVRTYPCNKLSYRVKNVRRAANRFKLLDNVGKPRVALHRQRFSLWSYGDNTDMAAS